MAKFRILTSGRQGGTTQYLVNMMADDYSEGKSVAIVSSNVHFRSAIEKIVKRLQGTGRFKNPFNRSNIRCISNAYEIEGIKFDSIYVLKDINIIEDNLMEKLNTFDKVIYCDKITLKEPINKIDYDLAKYYNGLKKMKNKDLERYKQDIEVLMMSVDSESFKSIIELSKKRIYLYDFEFLQVDNSFKIVDRINLLRELGSHNIELDGYGKVFV